MSKKSAKILALIESFQGKDRDAHYLGFFACFNEGLYYEAHDVLEELWLAVRSGPNYHFYKGLIQLAGAFVHLQKNRLKPATALFRLSRDNLVRYATPHEGLDLVEVVELIDQWNGELVAGGHQKNPLNTRPAPRLNTPNG